MSTRSVTHRCTLNHVPLARVSLTPHAAHPPAAARYFMTSSGGQAHDVTPAGRQGQNRQKFIDSHTVDELVENTIDQRIFLGKIALRGAFDLSVDHKNQP